MLNCRHNYKGYALESRLHFRNHAATLKLKACCNPGKPVVTNDSPSSSVVEPEPVENGSDMTEQSLTNPPVDLHKDSMAEQQIECRGSDQS